MSYTILTIPFNLKEKEQGDFLKKGFVIDDIVPGFFENTDAGNPFLHYATFNPEVIKKTAINLFVELNFPNFNLNKQFNDDLFTSSSFFDTKHLKLAERYIHKADFNVLNEKKRSELKTLNEKKEAELNALNEKKDSQANQPNNFTIPYEAINSKFIYKKPVEGQNKPIIACFDIDKIKVYFNKSNLTKESICYGFIQLVLKWDFPNAQIMIDNLGPISELFRYYGEENQNKFELSWSNDIINAEIQEIEKRNRSGKVPERNIKTNNQKIEEYKKLLLHSYPKKIDFKLLIDKLLEQFTLYKTDAEIFNFEKVGKIKPYILHLSNFQKANELKTLNFESKEVKRSIHRMIRIAGEDNIEINEVSNLNFVSPDYYSQQFILNEGAMVIEGIPQASELVNKYYPAFLLALNQKYLFHYIQEKINELPWDQSINQYKPDDLKVLQETMIYAEFSQIFTSLSNYNEIDLFFEKLRVQFKIEELKKEYLSSIEGISKITQINEDHKKELREKLNSSRLNLILVLLTIAQVWPNLYEVFLKSLEIHKIWIHSLVYSILITSGLYFYFIYLPNKSKNNNSK